MYFELVLGVAVRREKFKNGKATILRLEERLVLYMHLS